MILAMVIAEVAEGLRKLHYAEVYLGQVGF